jgi:hypothetical protein
MQIDCSQAGASSIAVVNLAGQTHPASPNGSQRVRHAVEPSAPSTHIHHPIVDLTTFAASADQPILSPSDLKNKLMQQPNTWANCSLEKLYDACVDLMATQSNTRIKWTHTYRKEKVETFITQPEALSVAIPAEWINEHEPTQHENFFSNINILLVLQNAYEEAEIIVHFPEVPKALMSTSTVQINLPLQQVKEMCIQLCQDEYMVIARLFLAETIEEKVSLLRDYMLPVHIAEQMEAGFARLSPEKKEQTLYAIFFEYFDHYSYALAGLYHLASRVSKLSVNPGKDVQKVAHLMQSYLAAAIKIVQSRNDFVKKQAAQMTKTVLNKGNRLGYEMRPIRFDIMLKSLQSVSHILNTYIEKEILPTIWEREFGIKETQSSAKKNKRRPQPAAHKKSGKKPPTVNQQPPVAKVSTQERAIPILDPPFEKIALPLEEVAAVREAVVVEPLINLPVSEVQEDKVTPSPALTHSDLARVAPIIASLPAEPSLPVSARVSLTEASYPPILLTENPILTKLNKRQKEIYEQIFAERWREAKGISLDAVEKLVTRLGGQTKGVGGSRTQIIFNHKSVATIEHRHGRDRAGELYKISVSLLQRGLGIAGFAPMGWEDQLSRTRDLLINFREYAAQRAQSS